NDPILNDLRKCFRTVAPSRGPQQSFHRLEIELFSSDFGTESSADLQAQISAFDTKTGNKVAEAGFRMDHQPYQPKAKSPPPKAVVAPAQGNPVPTAT